MRKFDRIDYLDSMRGIAAFAVVVYHFIGWHWGSNTTYHIASFIFNGSEAVSFFFVLSGFVLSFKYLHSDTKVGYGYYTYKRILRLYPAFIVTVLLNYLYWNRGLIMDGEIGKLISQTFTSNPKKLWHELAMVKDSHKYYIPGRTLGVEMALSLLMPVFVLAAKKDIKVIYWFLPFTFFMGSYISMFAFHFLLGIVVASAFYKIKDADFKTHAWYKYRYLVYTIVVFMFSMRHVNRMFNFGPNYFTIMEFLNVDFTHYSAIASAAIMVYVINKPKVQKRLVNPVWLYLGKISYSVYLCHWLLVVFIMEHWEEYIGFFNNFTLGFMVLLFIYAAITIIIASAMYYSIEKPFINFAKKYRFFENRQLKNR